MKNSKHGWLVAVYISGYSDAAYVEFCKTEAEANKSKRKPTTSMMMSKTLPLTRFSTTLTPVNMWRLEPPHIRLSVEMLDNRCASAALSVEMLANFIL